MRALGAMFTLAGTVGIVALAAAAAYLGYRVTRAIRVYFRFRGTRLVTCPETLRHAVVGVAARSVAMEAILNEPCLRISECSRWPMREGCGQDCLKQIEPHAPEVRFTTACKAS